MSDKKYPGMTEDIDCLNYRISIKHSCTGRKPQIRILLGPGLSGSSDDELLKRMNRLAAEEQIDLVRFDYPNGLSTLPFGPDIKKRRKIYKSVFEHILEQSEDEVPLFIGGKSISAYFASDIRDRHIKGYIFLSLPLRFPKLRIKIPLPGLAKLHKAMLFIQGKSDPVAPVKDVEKRIKTLNPHAYLMLLPDADHALEPLPNADRNKEEIHEEITNVLFWFMSDVLHKQKLN